MSAGRFIRSAAIAFLLLVLSGVSTATPMGDALREADRVRSSDPAALDRWIARAEALAASADRAEREHLALLHAYRAAVRGRFNEAINRAMALADTARVPDIRYRAALLVANVAAAIPRYALGMDYLGRALAMRRQIRDPEVGFLGPMVAIALYNEMGQHAQALRHAEEVLASTGRTPRERCVARHGRAQALQALGARLDMQRDLLAPLDACLAAREPIMAVLLRTVQARYLARTGQPGQAISALEAAVEPARATRYPRIEAEVLGLLARYRLQAGDAAGAGVAARQATALHVAGTVHSESQTDAQQVLYRLALARGDTASALTHYRAYAEANRVLQEDVAARMRAVQQALDELTRRRAEAASLQRENEMLRLRQEVDRRTAWNLRLLVALLVVVAAFAALWGWRARRVQRSLRRLAETDALTGIGNRRHFSHAAQRLLAQAAPKGEAGSMLLIDLDHFKQINDRCGHAAGDRVLREVARVGRLHLRGPDAFGRIGGEEFAMLLVGRDITQALAVAEALRQALASIDARVTRCDLPVTGSIGVACTALSGHGYETLLAHADAAMYAAKLAGRNRVCLHEPERHGALRPATPA